MITIKKDALTTRMVKQGFTAAKLAEASKISQGYVSMILSEKRLILPPTAKKICDALSCEFDDIFNFKQEV